MRELWLPTPACDLGASATLSYAWIMIANSSLWPRCLGYIKLYAWIMIASSSLWPRCLGYLKLYAWIMIANSSLWTRRHRYVKLCMNYDCQLTNRMQCAIWACRTRNLCRPVSFTIALPSSEPVSAPEIRARVTVVAVAADPGFVVVTQVFGSRGYRLHSRVTRRGGAAAQGP